MHGVKARLRKMIDPTPLIFPQLGPLYAALAPWAEALLRVVAGLALVPHGLRNTFGMFPSTGVQSHNLTELAVSPPCAADVTNAMIIASSPLRIVTS